MIQRVALVKEYTQIRWNVSDVCGYVQPPKQAIFNQNIMLWNCSKDYSIENCGIREKVRQKTEAFVDPSSESNAHSKHSMPIWLYCAIILRCRHFFISSLKMSVFPTKKASSQNSPSRFTWKWHLAKAIQKNWRMKNKDVHPYPEVCLKTAHKLQSIYWCFSNFWHRSIQQLQKTQRIKIYWTVSGLQYKNLTRIAT